MTKAEQARLVSWRLKILQRAEEGPRRVAQTCRHFGISRKTFYKWKHRHAAHAACLQACNSTTRTSGCSLPSPTIG